MQRTSAMEISLFNEGLCNSELFESLSDRSQNQTADEENIYIYPNRCAPGHHSSYHCSIHDILFVFIPRIDSVNQSYKTVFTR